ncbi:MAG: AEC family transporter [Bacillota bacterium]|nr:AEC family transporter [Bacillota bacterium]
MSENFIICIEAVLPMFILLAIGYATRIVGLVNDSEADKLNSLAFKILFPFLMFNNIYSTDISESVNRNLIVFALAAIGIVYFVATLVALRVERMPQSRGAMIQAIYRSNFVIMGLPLATNIYGHGTIGVTAVMVAIVVPVYNVLAVITLEIYRKGKIKVHKIIKNVLTNPLIIGAVAGIVCALFRVNLPGVVETTISQLAACATPVGIMILGASFRLTSVKAQTVNLVICLIGRLIVVPGAVLTTAALIGIRDINFVTLIAIFASPCALSSYTMARQMHSDYHLAGNTVVFSSALCCFTMFMWLYVFKSMGIF